MLAALQAGCTSFESSVGELGGCPVPPGATGNIATEDLVSMLHEMGIETGIDLDALLDAARDGPQRCSAGRWARTRSSPGPIDWHPRRGAPAPARRGPSGPDAARRRAPPPSGPRQGRRGALAR